MRIENPRFELNQNKARAVATVVWEDCDRPTRDVYFEVEDAFAQDLDCNPHAFLVGAVIPAMRHGEERIAIDQPICPELRTGLINAMGWLCHWYGPPRKLVRIEARPGVRLPMPRTSQRAGSFLSGGVDSLALLRANRLGFPLDHPGSIKDCLVVHGFDIGAIAGFDPEFEIYQRALSSLSAAAADAGVTLIPVSTNVRHLDDDVDFWIYEYHGAALASVGHAFSDRLSAISIASTYDIPNMKPWGSHPLLDPDYSSWELQIRHEGIRLSRLDKVRLLADWDVALRNLRVCTMNPAGELNCGECEKCIRTMLELLAVGKLGQAGSFAVHDVSPELLASITINTNYEDACHRELIDPFSDMGRLDLVEVIQHNSAEFHRRIAWEQEQDWKGAVKRFDRRYLKSSLFRSYKAVQQQVKKPPLP